MSALLLHKLCRLLSNLVRRDATYYDSAAGLGTPPTSASIDGVLEPSTDTIVAAEESGERKRVDREEPPAGRQRESLLMSKPLCLRLNPGWLLVLLNSSTGP